MGWVQLGKKPGRPEKLSGEGVNKKLKRLWKIHRKEIFYLKKGFPMCFKGFLEKNCVGITFLKKG